VLLLRELLLLAPLLERGAITCNPLLLALARALIISMVNSSNGDRASIGGPSVTIMMLGKASARAEN
jgi:hypothetical protein